MEIQKKVIEIVCQQLDVEPEKVTMDSSFIDDLHADSLAVVELVLAFETAFDLEIKDENTQQLRTVKNAVDFITAELAKQNKN